MHACVRACVCMRVCMDVSQWIASHLSVVTCQLKPFTKIILSLARPCANQFLDDIIYSLPEWLHVTSGKVQTDKGLAPPHAVQQVL